MVVFAVYSACVDPDRVLRALRPLAGRSALTATLVSRLVPVAAADAARLRDAAALRGPGAAAVGRGAMARRLLAGSLDRSVDVAATLELRGYSLDAPRAAAPARALALRPPLLSGRRRGPGRGDRRQARSAPTTSTTYPRIAIGTGPATLGLAAVLLASGLAPLRRRGGGGRAAARRGARRRRLATARAGVLGAGRV